MTPEHAIRLHTTTHPDKSASVRFDGLIGLEQQTEDLLEYLLGVLEPDRVKVWEKRHHAAGCEVARRLERRPPLAVLAGDVGCGKSELASSIGTPLAKSLDARLRVFETPSDIRGGGLVGELSQRITAAFEAARSQLAGGPGLLIIDEGDDLATSREQNQAHHEDRAGLNVLIKQIDALARDQVRLGVILVTNRLAALDPALLRRAHVIRFSRPPSAARRALFERLLGSIASPSDLDALTAATEREVPFTYSDLVTRILEPAVRRAMRNDKPLSLELVLGCAQAAEPTPIFFDRRV